MHFCMFAVVCYMLYLSSLSLCSASIPICIDCCILMYVIKYVFKKICCHLIFNIVFDKIYINQVNFTVPADFISILC